MPTAARASRMGGSGTVHASCRSYRTRKRFPHVVYAEPPRPARQPRGDEQNPPPYNDLLEFAGKMPRPCPCLTSELFRTSIVTMRRYGLAGIKIRYRRARTPTAGGGPAPAAPSRDISVEEARGVRGRSHVAIAPSDTAGWRRCQRPSATHLAAGAIASRRKTRRCGRTTRARHMGTGCRCHPSYCRQDSVVRAHVGFMRRAWNDGSRLRSGSNSSGSGERR